jgi:TonB family protein
VRRLSDCGKIEKLLWDYTDGKIDSAAKSQVESHLQTCAQCRKALQTISLLAESARQDQASLSSLAADVFDFEVIKRIKNQKVRAEAPAAPSRQYVYRMAFSFALAAGVVLFIVRSISDVDNIVVPSQKPIETALESGREHALIHLEYGAPKGIADDRQTRLGMPEGKLQQEQLFSILPSPITAPSPDSVNIAAVFLSADSIPSRAQTTMAASLADVLADTELIQTIRPSAGQLVTMETMPRAINMVRPEYPVWAKKRGLSGVVWIKAKIGANGDVIRSEVLSCSVPGAGFEESALEAARLSKFEPAMSNGISFPVWIIYPVKFIYKD